MSGDLAQALYDQVIAKTVRVSSARAAEASKLVENIFRAVNIALVNELKIVFDRMGIDVWEVLDAASTKPFGFMRFNPGPGWGGHCIPLDPFYLSWKAREFGVAPEIHRAGGRDQRGDAGLRRRKDPGGPERRAANRSKGRGSWFSASPTRRTSTTRARARPSRSSTAS